MSNEHCLNVIKPGTLVKLGGHQALVLGVTVDTSLRARYEVVWWSSADRKTAWVDALELSGATDNLPIGFGGQP